MKFPNVLPMRSRYLCWFSAISATFLILVGANAEKSKSVAHRSEPRQSLSHAPQSQATLPSSGKRLAATTIFNGDISFNFAPPLSRVSDDAEGTLYNRDVNRINDVVNVGASAEFPSDDVSTVTTAERTWLATERGVKYIDRKKGVSRIYGMAEGLPGTQVVAIVGDVDGVWCLVRDHETVIADAKKIPQLHLCRYDARADHWREQASLDAPYRRYITTSWNPYEGRCLVSLTRRYVVVVSGVVHGDEDAFAYLYDRKRGTATTLPWDFDLQADTSAVLPTVLLADDRGVTVGTDHGLLRWDFARAKWSRLLPDRFIDCGASAGVSGAVWVASHARLRPLDSGFQPNAAPSEWNLTRVTLADNAVTTWTPPRSAAVPAMRQDPFYKMSDADAAEEMKRSVPCGLFAAGDFVWTAHRATYGGYGTARGWLRLAPASGEWSESVLALSDPATASRFGMRPPKASSAPATPPLPPLPHLDFDTVPNGAVRALALRRSRPLRNSIDSGSGIGGDPEQYCIRRCFPDWLTKEASAEDGVPAEASIPVGDGSRRDAGPIQDPDHPNLVWVLDLSKSILVLCPPQNIPLELHRGKRTYSVDRNPLDKIPDWETEQRGARYFPLPPIPDTNETGSAVRPIHRYSSTAQFAVSHGFVYCFLVGRSAPTIGRLETATGKWTMCSATEGVPSQTSGGEKLVSDGDQGAWLVYGDTVFRYNVAANRWDHLFGSDFGHLPLPEMQIALKPASLSEKIGYDSIVYGSGSESDVLVQYGVNMPDGRQYPFRPCICRFANSDGHLIATLLCDRASFGWGIAVGATGQDLWVGMNRGLFHVRKDAAPDTAWKEVPLATGPIEGQMREMLPGPNDGLWIVSSECAYLWKHPHD